MPRLPASIEQFIEQQKTLPVDELWKGGRDEYRSAYGSYWYRAVACILLSGRVSPKAGGDPNMTEARRLGKEANFNPYLLERVARLLLKARVLTADRSAEYVEGPNFASWWAHDAAKLPELTRRAFLELVQERTGYQPWRPTTVHNSGLVEFLQLFFSCFRDRALPEAQAGSTFAAFSRLPREDLRKAAKALRVGVDDLAVGGWHHWLDEKGQKALLHALYTTEWAWYGEHDRAMYLFLSPLGEGMLGLKKPPPPYELSTDLKLLPSNTVFAGAGLAMDRLATLFRCCKVNRIDQVYEFQIERRRLAELPARGAPAAELRRVLQDAGPLPATVEDVLGTRPRAGGRVDIRWCSALVQPESMEVLDAIRRHPRLKGYLEAGAPPGYLLVKARSSPENFVRRCQELGFQVALR
jgi:hypothetical protein